MCLFIMPAPPPALYNCLCSFKAAYLFGDVHRVVGVLSFLSGALLSLSLSQAIQPVALI